MLTVTNTKTSSVGNLPFQTSETRKLSNKMALADPKVLIMERVFLGGYK